MLKQRNQSSVEDLVFYVDEEGDDYTFYLARDTDNSVFSKLAWARVRERLRLDPSNKAPFGGEFSFSERIKVKRLGEIKDSFWRNFKNPKGNSPYQYLWRIMEDKVKLKIKSTIEAEASAGKEARQILNKLGRGGPLRRGDKQKLRPLLTLALNEAVHQADLKRYRSFGKILRKLSEEEKKTPIAFVDEDQQRQSENLNLIEIAFPALKRKEEWGRGLICFSHAGKYLSVTVRKVKEQGGYKADFLSESQKYTRRKYLFSAGEYCRQIYEQVFWEKELKKQAHGLLVVTGSTNSLKSEIARGLIDLYLTNTKGLRRHHLVTFEDPIEKQLYPDDDIKGYPYMAVSPSAKPADIDYTPRQKQKDVHLLKDALTDALRQTPAVFFVGETRAKEEWEVLLDFAATGHLIVTTAHAGSLVEAMHKIFEAVDAKTPADRSEVAEKLLGIIHLRAGTLVFQSKKLKTKSADEVRSTSALFPALWRRTPRGIAALTSDGLASLLPHRPRKDDDADKNRGEDAASCLGRRWFIEQLIQLDDEKTRKQMKDVFKKRLEALTTQAYKRATEWDLQGV